MARDDYFVVVYKILKYLYACLKKGKAPCMTLLSADFFSVNAVYWDFIIANLHKEGCISGIVVADSGAVGIRPDIRITPKGIQYLEKNSMLVKVKATIKDIRDVLPV